MNYKDYVATNNYQRIKRDLSNLKDLIHFDKNPYYNSYIDPDLNELFKRDEILQHIKILSQSHKEISSQDWLNLAHWATYFNHIDVFKAMLMTSPHE